MTAKIHLERSETLAESYGLPAGGLDLTLDTSDGQWVQFTYEALRTQDGGDVVVYYSDGAWWVPGSDAPYSDIVVELIDQEERTP